jgi:hypothetical protein
METNSTAMIALETNTLVMSFLAMSHVLLETTGAYLLSSDSSSYPRDCRSANAKRIMDRIQKSMNAW